MSHTLNDEEYSYYVWTSQLPGVPVRDIVVPVTFTGFAPLTLVTAPDGKEYARVTWFIGETKHHFDIPDFSQESLSELEVALASC